MFKIKNNFCLTLVIVCYFWQLGRCVNSNAEIDNNTKKDVSDEKDIRNIHGYLNKVNEYLTKTSTTGIPINNFDPENSIGNGERGLNEKFYVADDNGDKGIFEKDGYRFDYDAGNPDINGDMKRPCQVYDTFCIRKFFAEHSHCKISGRAVPDPLYRAEGTINFPSVNISSSEVNAVYTGLSNGRIVEFYINKVTDNLVIVFTFDNVTRSSINIYYKYYLRGREPVVTRDFGGLRFGQITITVIIPQLKNLRLDKADIYTYGDNNIYPFVLGPRVGASTDPEVPSMFARFNSNVPIDYQEEIFAEGNFMAANYIQYNICDFGLKIV